MYSLDLLLGAHPGGWKIINKIRNREVDRFLYGMEPIENFIDKDKPYTHTIRSLEIAS